MITAGIDAGSRTLKAVIWNTDTGQVMSRDWMDQGVEQAAMARQLFERCLQKANLQAADIKAIIATGYGRDLLDFADTTLTEITCHAVGVRSQLPEVKTIIEIGGQDSKLIRLGPDGGVRDFVMNDRCAAGTGSFLELAARRLQTDLNGLGELAQQCTEPVSINSTCAVFAETEIIGLLAQRHSPSAIAGGVLQSISRRIAAMAGRKVDTPIGLTGGVALVSGIRESLEQIFKQPIQVLSNPLFTGAQGAAILAAKPMR
jgi:predicted CoA-substrate-specific enzyme activase